MVRFLFISFLAVGLFIVASEALRLPPIATAKGIKTAVKSQQSLLGVILTAVVMPIVKLVSPFIMIADFKEK